MPNLRFLLVVLLFTAMLGVVIGGALALDRHGHVAPGTVVAKRESIHAQFGRTLLVEVVYEPRDYSARDRFVRGGLPRRWIAVNATTYDRLGVGDRVDVRYPAVLPTFAVLARPSAVAQLPWHLLVALSLLVLVVFRNATRPGVPPLLIGAVLIRMFWSDPAPDAPSTLLEVAALSAAVIVCAWAGPRTARWGRAGGRAVARLTVQCAGLALLFAVIAPASTLFGAATHRETAVVRAVQSFTVDGSESSPLLRPFTLVELDVAPAGMRHAVVAADAIDMGSAPELRVGSRVAVDVPDSAPRRATIVGATRTYRWKNSALAMLAGAACWLIAALRATRTPSGAGVRSGDAAA